MSTSEHNIPVASDSKPTEKQKGSTIDKAPLRTYSYSSYSYAVDPVSSWGTRPIKQRKHIPEPYGSADIETEAVNKKPTIHINPAPVVGYRNMQNYYTSPDGRIYAETTIGVAEKVKKPKLTLKEMLVEDPDL